MNIIFLTAMAGILVGGGYLFLSLTVHGGSTLYNPDEYGMCAPARYDSLTGQPTAASRRIVAELAPPAGWRDVGHVAIVPVPVSVAARGDDWDDDPDELDDWGDDEPEELLLAVGNLPTRQPVEPPAAVKLEPVPVVVNRTAARFMALEIGR